MDAGLDKARQALLFLAALVVSITVHEFGHAFAAHKLGDPTPRAQGRLTLSPLAHADPWGTLIIPLVAIFGGLPLLGWGRPVITNPSLYRRLRGDKGHMLVAAAGPLMNLALALVVSLAVAALGRAGVLSQDLAIEIVARVVLLNISLMVFNLLPVPPLDGGAVLRGLVPRSAVSLHRALDLMQRWGFVVLFLVVASPLVAVLMAPARWIGQAWVRVLFKVAFP